MGRLRRDSDGSPDWPEPRPEYLEATADMIRRRRRPSPGVRLRAGLAVGLAALVIAGIGASAGSGFAGGGLRGAVQVVKAAVGPTVGGRSAPEGRRHRGPDDHQYEEDCRDEVRNAIHAERARHKEAVRAERARHKEAMKAARRTPGKADDRAEERLHDANERAEERRHDRELRRLERELERCEDD